MKQEQTRREIIKKFAFGGIAAAGAFFAGRFIGQGQAQPISEITTIEPGSLVVTASYIMFYDGTTFYARNGETGKIEFNGSNGKTVLESCINAISDATPEFGGSIYLYPSVRIDDTITIDKSRISLVSDRRQSDEQKRPGIQRVLIDSTSDEIRDIILDGISMRELDFYSNGNDIEGVLVNGCEIVAGTAANQGGVIFRGASFTQYVDFTNCSFDDYNNGGTFIVFQNTIGGTGHVTFQSCNYFAKVANCTFCKFDTNFISGVPIRFDSVSIIQHSNATSFKVFHMAAHTENAKGVKMLQIGMLFLEIDENSGDIFTIDASSGTDEFFNCVIDNLFVIPMLGAGTTKLIVNNNNNWDSEPQGLQVLGGSLIAKTSTFDIGTPNESASFKVIVKNFRGYDPQGWNDFTKGGAFLDPDAARDVTIWRAPFACTVTNIRGYRVGGTGTTINARLNGTSEHLSSDLSLTSIATWMDGGAVQNAIYAAGDKLELRLKSITGTPTEVTIEVDFTRISQ